jgi:hypothetical protein
VGQWAVGFWTGSCFFLTGGGGVVGGFKRVGCSAGAMSYIATVLK